ncbi:uncharacterized protein LOC124172401 [Ischnura elegans]|uniref:uncharacterized protein LOC124172401 n=1 Tax=Ischnura elegans TaxID=197161 RepID=UPI001ED886CB|nr:uncharacterized protein LOC124172401 [Ischnura elegans]
MDNTGILSVPSQSAYRCNPHIMRMNSLVCRTTTVDDAVAQDHTYAQLLNVSRLSDYVQDVVAYVSGFVQKKILKTLECDECRQGLLQNPEDDCTSLLKRRNMGGLTTPCKDIVNICRAVERAFREAQAAGKLRRKDIFHILTLEAFKGIASQFHILRDHILDQDFEENHINNLVRAIIYEYLSIRLYHVGKSIVSELKLNYSRSINTKTIHIKGH